jgi:hypothetical protein
MLHLSAELTARLCKRYAIPPVLLLAGDLVMGRRGITTHRDVTEAFKRSTHTDPGASFPREWYLQRVDEALKRLG